ncbi:MAG: hypothetical protein ACTHKG_16405 [Nocardioides sp.]
MLHLTTDTFARPADPHDASDPRVLYVRSYLLIRTAVGTLGALLPTMLFLLEWAFLRGDATVRGSLSAYYFTPARDLFVGVLCTAGVLLVTYLAGQVRTWDFWLSSAAGVAALGVAFFPTERPGLRAGAAACGPGVTPRPRGCTALQQAWGETTVAAVHYASAAVFILAMAAICFVFAHRDARHGVRRSRVRFHRACGTAILVAVGWILLGLVAPVDVAGLAPLYLGEVVSLYAFAASWLVKGHDLRRLLPQRLRARWQAAPRP